MRTPPQIAREARLLAGLLCLRRLAAGGARPSRGERLMARAARLATRQARRQGRTQA